MCIYLRFLKANLGNAQLARVNLVIFITTILRNIKKIRIKLGCKNDYSIFNMGNIFQHY